MTASFELHAHSLSQLQAQCDVWATACTRGRATPDLTARFLANLALLRADLLADLFPALLESMAGSDAVCIRAMQAGAAARLDTLDAAWRAMDGAPEAARELLGFEHAEILPLATRLLDDHALAQVQRAMRARREVT